MPNSVILVLPNGFQRSTLFQRTSILLTSESALLYVIISTPSPNGGLVGVLPFVIGGALVHIVISLSHAASLSCIPPRG